MPTEALLHYVDTLLKAGVSPEFTCDQASLFARCEASRQTLENERLKYFQLEGNEKDYIPFQDDQLDVMQAAADALLEVQTRHAKEANEIMHTRGLRNAI